MVFKHIFGPFGHLFPSLTNQAKVFQFEHALLTCTLSSVCIRLSLCLCYKPRYRGMSFLGQNLAEHWGHVSVLGKEVGHAE